HFEKMLYDQAQLALAYVEAGQASGDPFYLEVAEDTLLYVLREMTDAAGGFFSAEDADSVPPEAAGSAAPEKKEGAFYLWRADELDALLGGDADVVKLRFGIEPNGNAPHDPQQEFTGKNLLYVARSVDEVARAAGLSNDRVVEILNRARIRMFEARLSRPRSRAWRGSSGRSVRTKTRAGRSERPRFGLPDSSANGCGTPIPVGFSGAT